MTKSKLAKLILVLSGLLGATVSYSEGADKCAKDSKANICLDSEKKADEHGAGNPAVGANRGILSVNDKDGFKLADSAIKTFGLKLMPVGSLSNVRIPMSAIYYGLQETNVYRARSGFFKRIDFKILQKSSDTLVISSNDLASGDQLVIGGVAFLRIAELQAYGGVADEH